MSKLAVATIILTSSAGNLVDHHRCTVGSEPQRAAMSTHTCTSDSDMSKQLLGYLHPPIVPNPNPKCLIL